MGEQDRSETRGDFLIAIVNGQKNFIMPFNILHG
jgi:hypothetical protein